MTKTQAQLESSLRQFFRTRPNEELSRVANSNPDRFQFTNATWYEDKGCLICHLVDANDIGVYYSYREDIKGAYGAEGDYLDLSHYHEEGCDNERWAGAILIRLANEVLAERGDMNILDEVESNHERIESTSGSHNLNDSGQPA